MAAFSCPVLYRLPGPRVDTADSVVPGTSYNSDKPEPGGSIVIVSLCRVFE